MDRSRKGMTLMERVFLVVFTFLVAAAIGGLRPAEARRTNIQGGDQAVAVFQDQALTTTPVTSTYPTGHKWEGQTIKVPVGMTEGVAAAVRVTGLGPTDSVTLRRKEQIRSDETLFGTPIEPDTAPDIVLTGNQDKVYSIPFTEGVESISFTAECSLASGGRISMLVATQ